MLAERDLARLRDIEAALTAAKDEYWAAEVQVQMLTAQAWIADARGDRDHALALMGSAADKEDLERSSSVSPVTACCRRASCWVTLPAAGRPASRRPWRIRSVIEARSAPVP